MEGDAAGEPILESSIRRGAGVRRRTGKGFGVCTTMGDGVGIGGAGAMSASAVRGDAGSAREGMDVDDANPAVLVRVAMTGAAETGGGAAGSTDVESDADVVIGMDGVGAKMGAGDMDVAGAVEHSNEVPAEASDSEEVRGSEDIDGSNGEGEARGGDVENSDAARAGGGIDEDEGDTGLDVFDGPIDEGRVEDGDEEAGHVVDRVGRVEAGVQGGGVGDGRCETEADGTLRLRLACGGGVAYQSSPGRFSPTTLGAELAARWVFTQAGHNFDIRRSIFHDPPSQYSSIGK